MKKIFFTLVCLVTAAGLIGLSGCDKEQNKPVKKRGTLIIKSTPAKADVIILKTKQGVTPLTRKRIEVGSYIVKLVKPGYQTEWRRVTVKAGKGYPVNITLTPIQASVLLVSKPDHVKIYLDNELRGETPLLLKRLPLGKYSARIEKQGFSTREISWTLENAKPKKISISLISNVAKLTIDSTPKECQVFINEQARGVTPLSLILEEGKHKIRLEKSGFSPVEESVTVLRAKKYTKNYTLKQLPGGLSITTIPADATIYINNRSCGNSPVKVEGLPAGKYTIRVTKNSFDVQKAVLVVDAGRITSKLFKLSRNTGGMDLIVNPPGTTIYINGKVRGMTEVDEDGINSKIIRIRNLRAGTYEVKIAHKRGNPSSRTYTIKVEKGKVFRHPKPAYLWVPNSELRLTGGRTFRGILVYKSKDGSKIMFSPEPGITQEFNRSEIISLKPISDDDE
jgi:PEGA domain